MASVQLLMRALYRPSNTTYEHSINQLIDLFVQKYSKDTGQDTKKAQTPAEVPL